MELYLSDRQKSSDLLLADYRMAYGLSLSTAAQAIKMGMTAHIRIYDAMLRLAWAGLYLCAAELSKDLTDAGIPLSLAQAQRVLKDKRLFSFVKEIENGKRGRRTKMYVMVSPQKVGDDLGTGLGATIEAPKLMPVDLSSVKNYRNAILGRVLEVRYNDCRQAQIEFWQVCKQTIIRWTKEICEILPRIKTRRSDDTSFTMYPDPQMQKDVFLWKVGDAERTKSRKYWLEIVNDAGEIRKLPCTQDNARRWLKKGVVTLCEQQSNFYSVHAAYRDPPMTLAF